MRNTGNFEENECSRIAEIEHLIQCMEDPKPVERIYSQSTHDDSFGDMLEDFEDEEMQDSNYPPMP